MFRHLFGKKPPAPEQLPPAALEAAFWEALAFYEQQQPELARQQLALGPGADWAAWWPGFAAGLAVAQGETLVRFSAALGEHPLAGLVYEMGRQLMLRDRDREIVEDPPPKPPEPEPPPPARGPSGKNQETLTLEELSARLQNDPEFLQQVAVQVGLPADATPEMVIQALLKKAQPSEAERYFQQGNNFYNAGKFAEAIASFEQAIALQPDDHEAWGNRSVAAARVDRYNLSRSRNFLLHFRHSVANSRPYLARSLQPPNFADFWRQFQQSWQAGRPLLRAAFAAPSRTLDSTQQAKILARLEATTLDSARFQLPPQQWQRLQAAARSRSFSPAAEARLEEIAQQHPALRFEALQSGGYPGSIASLETPLQAGWIGPDRHPLGWGFLNHELGRAHVRESRQARPAVGRVTCWQRARAAFEAALQTYTTAAFPHQRLEVLTELLEVQLHLNDLEAAKTSRSDALDLLRSLIDRASPAERRRLHLKFQQFQQLSIDVLLRDNQIAEALTSAELNKNRCLAHLLDRYRADTEAQGGYAPSLDQIRQLLAPRTALIYWHLSPYSLATFLLHPDEPSPRRVAPAAQATAFRDWLKSWDRQYQDYRRLKKGTGDTDRRQHPWRTTLPDQLDRLATCLDLASLRADLDGIEELILIPHRDLHRLPLHACFAQPCRYLPSAQLGLNLQPPAVRPAPRLLSVENPRRDMQYAELETAVINQFFPQRTELNPSNADLATVTTALQQPHSHFHFTGHGAHDDQHPDQSALELANDETLTAAAISRLDLRHLQLAALAACETALTTQQTIDTEYVGLASAFLQAGTRAVLSTLWNVEEISSTFLVIEFYQQLCHGQPPARALLAAQTWLRAASNAKLIDWLDQLLASEATRDLNADIRKSLTDDRDDRRRRPAATIEYASPYYWAAFALTGGESP